MKLLVPTLAALVAFAANSLLNRLGVSGLGMDPGMFAVIRVVSGAAALAVIVLWRGRVQAAIRLQPRRVGAAAALALYMIGFSVAYLTLDAGVGALILFGATQITMFAGAILGGEAVSARRVAGAVTAAAGLAVLAWPADSLAPLGAGGFALMALAGLGWGLYSLMGRSEPDPLAASAANFALCVPFVLPLVLIAGPGNSLAGIIVAVVAGALTSGMGYAVWYSVLPGLGAQRAAVSQLSVPVIAALGGAVLLGESVGLRFAIAAALVLGGIGMSVVSRPRRGTVRE